MIQSRRHDLWRAVDQDGCVLDILVQRRRHKTAAKKFFRTLLKGCRYVPRVLMTDQLKSYGAAKREILPGVEHRQHRYLNNRAENSHQPTRQWERRMQGFTSAGHAQRFLSAYGVRSPNTSDRDAIDSLPQRIAKPWSNDSRAGMKSRELQQHKKFDADEGRHLLAS